jgi:adenosylcobalamin-dependent ribonucleoside-triphosphate reductase
MSDAFIRPYMTQEPAWGPVGKVVYVRTYARELRGAELVEHLIRDFGKSPATARAEARKLKVRREEFWQTARRVVEFVWTVFKRAAQANHHAWDEREAQEKSEEMYRLLWAFKWLPPGRGMQFAGTPVVEKKGAAVLNNCGFVSTATIDADFADPFCAIMDFLMLGVGVGSDVQGAGKVVIHAPQVGGGTYRVEDSREGWVDAYRTKLNAYAGKCRMPDDWDFDGIRREGAILKTFGGTSSGPGPLKRLLDAVDRILAPLVGLPITKTAIADIVNETGVCVVAGNIRRSAEILLGEYGDEEFAALKDPTETRRLKEKMAELTAQTPEAAKLQRQIASWKSGQKGFSAASERFINLQNKIDRAKAKSEKIMRRNAEWAACETAYWSHPLFTHRWASNNTVLCRPANDFTSTGERIAANGEPGVGFMENIRAYGRMAGVGAMLPPRERWLDALVAGANPCMEQPLEDRELCCLGELNPNAHETLEEFLHTIKFAYMYCKAVTLLPTNHPETNRVMTRNRRIGLSMIGVFEMYERFGLTECIRWWDAGYNEVRRWDKTYSQWLGCNESIKVTSLKPGGSVPLLVGKEGGMKVPSAEYYFRTIRVEHRSALAKEARSKGYRVEKDRYSPRTLVIYFPVHDPNARRTANDVSMWEQLELLAAIQGYWSDNMVSNTINFKAHEAKDIPRAIAAFAHRVKAISFLPLDDHGYPQAPYIPISKEEYEYAAARCQPLDLRAVTHEVDEKYCTGESCEIRPN